MEVFPACFLGGIACLCVKSVTLWLQSIKVTRVINRLRRKNRNAEAITVVEPVRTIPDEFNHGDRLFFTPPGRQPDARLATMTDLSLLLTDDKRPAVLADLAAFADATVAKQSGLSGTAMKGAVAAAKKIDGDIVSKGLNRMLPDVLGDLQPHWQAFRNEGGNDFGAFLAGRSSQVVDSLMAIADRNAESITVAPLAKAYNALRGKAAKVIEPEIPEFGRILQKHMP